ncbi:PAS-domain containing protein [Paracoccus sp. MBLB3053]|uniref:PAS-domain containing protein n=1 Tax=Paracoccus aurantius TaxID=3073814 RepID=A0ABU2HNZ5_9RHOB|nr:PAS-domain containing protein [Paracoccus sp. MBLB3053]MDS9466767.1 PAS-domain containing protein [Paracoccus sp. MBLB3053]
MLTEFLIAFSAAAMAAGLSFAIVRWAPREAEAQKRLIPEIEPIVLLFREDQLIDATSPARSLLAALPGGDDWQRINTWLAMRLPDEIEAMQAPDRPARIELGAAAGSGLSVLAEDLGNELRRFTIADPTAENAGIMIDSLAFAAMEQELEMLRSTMDQSPMLAWRQDGKGQVTWANGAYLHAVDTTSGGETIWPLPQIVDLSARPQSGGRNPVATRRIQIQNDKQNRWYDCQVHDTGDQTIVIALPADAAVRAESSLREFVQTLTKTFADLPIGLAIFDRERNLQLFNPALIDLTGLATGFLTARPTLYAFLDRLREARMVPEPKDYRSWRQQMNSLENAAASGHHVEMWSLPGGQTYRVTGRPHPDGAVAFLFEDITSEISLTRKFRADLSLGGEVLDALHEAVAVFSANGDLLLSNRRYSEIWAGIGKGTAAEHVQHWISSCGESPGLASLRHALHNLAPEGALGGAMAGPNGGLLSWDLRMLSGGRLMLSFSVSAYEAQERGGLPVETVSSPRSDRGEGPRTISA